MDTSFQLCIFIWFTYSVIRMGKSSPSSEDCLSSCMGVPNGDYPSCEGCQYYVSCYYGEMTTHKCNANKIWDDKRKTCRNFVARLSRCASDESGEISTYTETTQSDLSDESTSNPVEKTLPEVYSTRHTISHLIIPLSITLGVFILASYLLCILWKYNWCKKKQKQGEMPPLTTHTSVATQTGVVVDDLDYQELYVPSGAPHRPPVRYMSMPYAVSDFHRYQDLTAPYSEPQTEPENVYLELLAYPYIQAQNERTRARLQQMVSPIVKALCSEDTNTDDYILVEDKLRTLAEQLGGNNKNV